jgi:hypothetical protein
MTFLVCRKIDLQLGQIKKSRELISSNASELFFRLLPFYLLSITTFGPIKFNQKIKKPQVAKFIIIESHLQKTQ